MRTWLVGAAFAVGIALVVGCSGVTPSVKVGVLHRSTGEDLTFASSATGAFKIDALGYGGSLELRLHEGNAVIIPCGLLTITTIGSTSEKETEGDHTYNRLKSLYMTEVPAELCVEVNTAEVSN